MRLDDPLGHLIPPGQLCASDIGSGLVAAMEQRRFLSGHGIPSVPTRFVVTMNPADRAWLEPTTEDDLARALERHADRGGTLLVGPIEISFETDPTAALGRPLYWAGFTDNELLVLAAPKAALDVFARA